MEISPIWLTEAEVVSLIDMGEAIQCVEQGFTAEAIGQGANLLKTHLGLEGGSVHSLGGTLEAYDVVGVKSWVHSQVNSNPLLTLWRISDGSLLAVIEAFALGQYRTAAVVGAATRAMARPDANRMTILGTGRQALTQVGAVAAVRHLSEVTVWGRDERRRAEFAEAVTGALGIPAVAAASVEEACEHAEIVTLATRATAPFLLSDAIAPGTHVNAVGAITPERAEFEPKLLGRCRSVACDSVHAARRLSREFTDFYGPDEGSWADVRSVASVIAEGDARSEPDDITLFKSMGVGLADVAIGRFVYEQAIENRIGRALAAPSPSRPRLRSNLVRPGAGYV